ncbi:MAG: transglutaminase family protein [Rhodoferax sp.]|nr:transglutaminase family protein [Rhodoferax sp.]
MDLRVIHETLFDYTPPVKTAQHMAYLKPLDTATQKLVSHKLDVRPAPSDLSEMQDVFGNTRSFFSLQVEHDELAVIATSVVSTSAVAAPRSTLPWEQVRDRFHYRAGAPYDAAAGFVFASPLVPRYDDFAAYARPSFGPGVPLLAAARDLMTRIHGEFRYEPQSTDVSTPVLEALSQRTGVCQDFAHIMVACLRAMGLPARYVSGYLLTQPPPGQPRLVGSDASHAWASVYLPDLLPGLPELSGGPLWCDFDPTNDRFGAGTPGEDYVTLAIGRDYGDVAPLRGVIHGGADHTLEVRVTVEPINSQFPEDSP